MPRLTTPFFPELLYRLVHGADARKLAKEKVGVAKIRRKVAEVRAARLDGTKRARGHTAAPQPAAAPVLADFVSAALSNLKTKL